MARFSLQPIVNVTFAVECFFVVSGTLSAYLTLKDMETHKRFRFKYFYLNRFVRLSPLFYLYTMIAYKLSARFGHGPLWFTLDASACANTWWCNILYITNTRELLDMCIWVTWHISAEVHLFIFSPIFIVCTSVSFLLHGIDCGGYGDAWCNYSCGICSRHQ